MISLLFFIALGHATPICQKGTSEGDKFIKEKRFQQAIDILEPAVIDCAIDKTFKSARPFIALGKAYYEMKRFEDAIVQFKKGIEYQPDIALFYNNISAAYIGLENYDKAIESAKKAIELSSSAKDGAEANFNAGLAYVKKAALKNDPKDNSGEPYFMKSKELNPSFAANYFYLGAYQESSYENIPKAKAFYKEACDLKHEQSCQLLSTIEQRALINATNPMLLSDSNKALLDKLEALYQKKGYDLNTTQTIVRNIANACTAIPEEHCKGMIENTLKASDK